jgi:UDP-glucose 4-epimerase
MRALVTGGAGFIGSNLVDKLIAEDYEVVVVDDLSTGKSQNLNEKAQFYSMDLRHRGLKELFRDRVDVVFHYAAQARVRVSLEDPLYDAEVNVKGTVNLLEASKGEVDKIIYASSGGAVYGEPEYLPVDEKHRIAPLSPYGVSKYIVEEYLRVYQGIYGLPYTAMRYGNVYGPRQDPYGEAGVIAIFGGKMLKDESPTINGDGEQTRDFIYVRDAVEAALRAAEKKATGPINIATGVETSVNEIYRALKKLSGSGVEARYGPAIKGEVRRIYLDISRAEKRLHWKPRVSLGQGINAFLNYLRG